MLLPSLIVPTEPCSFQSKSGPQTLPLWPSLLIGNFPTQHSKINLPRGFECWSVSLSELQRLPLRSPWIEAKGPTHARGLLIIADHPRRWLGGLQRGRWPAALEAVGVEGAWRRLRSHLNVWQLPQRTLSLESPLVMGIVNVTPDSFSDGGRFVEADLAVRHGLSLLKAGAAILDIGGESTRPGAAYIDAEEEMRRVLPVIEGLRAESNAPISIDTRKARVAKAAILAGAEIVNDVSGLHDDPKMSEVVAESGAGVVLMHMRGTSKTMQRDTTYPDLFEEVLEHLLWGVDAASKAGVKTSQILVDPGIGFGKDLSQNLTLIHDLGSLHALGFPILLGPSRKRFIGDLTGRPAPLRVAGTCAAVAVGVMAGAAVIRAHDVAEVFDAIQVADALKRSRDASDDAYHSTTNPTK